MRRYWRRFWWSGYGLWLSEIRAGWHYRRPGLRGELMWLENHINHPYPHAYPDDPGTHWAPLSERICNLADRLTGGECHD